MSFPMRRFPRRSRDGVIYGKDADIAGALEASDMYRRLQEELNETEGSEDDEFVEGKTWKKNSDIAIAMEAWEKSDIYRALIANDKSRSSSQTSTKLSLEKDKEVEDGKTCSNDLDIDRAFEAWETFGLCRQLKKGASCQRREPGDDGAPIGNPSNEASHNPVVGAVGESSNSSPGADGVCPVEEPALTTIRAPCVDADSDGEDPLRDLREALSELTQEFPVFWPTMGTYPEEIGMDFKWTNPWKDPTF